MKIDKLVKKGLIISPVKDSDKYESKSIWTFVSYDEIKKIVTLSSASEESLEINIPFTDFSFDFRSATEILVSGDDHYGKAFRINMNVKLLP